MRSSPADRAPPTLAVLTARIGQFCEFAITDAGAANLSSLIRAKALEGAVCAGAMVGPPPGKWRALRFADYYECVFGVDLDGDAIKPPRKRRGVA